jgi:flavin reductase (DIM6/NTAB) family NADH-FMN oxidoreductase RutF
MHDPDKRFALRMIPYGVFVVTAINPATMDAAGVTIHWLTQTSFSPCLLAACVKSDHPVINIVRQTNRFAINMLGKEDAGEAFTFARPSILTGNLNTDTARLGGWGVSWGRRGNMLLQNAVACLECDLRAMMEAGDHYPLIAEVVDAHVRLPPDGRPDDMSLRMSELGQTIFYGG